MDNKPSVGQRAVMWILLATKLSKLVKLAKFAKMTKPLITVVTMSVSAVAYTFWLGPWFAIGLVAMLFIHEMGHVIALNMRGYKASAPVFIPFLGAVIFAPRMDNRDDEAFVGIGGPVLGSLAAALVLGVWFFVEDKESDLAVILLMVSYIGMFLNAFNMLPIRPLDGGRITQAVGPGFKYVGITALAVFSIFFQEPVILLIWLLVLPELTFLSLKLRASLGVILWTAMVVLMIAGYSSQHWIVDLIDCVVGGMIMSLLVVQAYTRTDFSEEDDQRPQLEPSARVLWFVRFIVLTAILVGLMMYQVQQIPAVAQ